MVFLEDPITIDAPTRFQTEEDEELAQGLADQYRIKPTVQLGGEAAAAPSGGTVLFLVGPAAALLAHTSFRSAASAGAITVPELQRLRSPAAEEYGAPAPITHTATILRLGSLMVVAAERFLPPEQAVAWAEAVFEALRPDRVAVVTTIAAMEYRGPGSPADEDLIFSLETFKAAAAAAGSASSDTLPPQLPPGTLLGGLPAALLGMAQRRGLQGVAVAGVQLGPAPDTAFVRGLATAVLGALGVLGVQDVSGQVLGGVELLAEIKATTDRMYRSSASNSIFI